MERKYEPVNPAIDGLNMIARSGYIAIGGMVGSSTVVTSTIAGAPLMVPSAGLIGCIGIEFYQLQNGVYYLLASKNSLRIEQVFNEFRVTKVLPFRKAEPFHSSTLIPFFICVNLRYLW